MLLSGWLLTLLAQTSASRLYLPIKLTQNFFGAFFREHMTGEGFTFTIVPVLCVASDSVLWGRETESAETDTPPTATDVPVAVRNVRRKTKTPHVPVRKFLSTRVRVCVCVCACERVRVCICVWVCALGVCVSELSARPSNSIPFALPKGRGKSDSTLSSVTCRKA